jgi:hypothetical protein
MRFGCAL